jgi:hypothetical protein
MAKLSDTVASTTHRVLVFGPPKVGKTQLVGQLAEKFDLIWFDLESGHNTLRKLPLEYQKRIELIQLPDSKSYPIAVETLLKVITGAKVKICEAHGKVACPLCAKDNKPVVEFCLNEVPSTSVVVFDSLTQFTSSATANLTKNQPDDYKMQRDDWGNLKIIVEKFLSGVQAARCNIVCISHEEEAEMEDGRTKIVPVCGSSKSSRNTAKYFDHVVYAEIKNRKHIAASATTYANNIMTGSRTDVDLEKTPGLLTIFQSVNVAPPTQGQVALSSLQALKLSKGN